MYNSSVMFQQQCQALWISSVSKWRNERQWRRCGQRVNTAGGRFPQDSG